MIVWLRGFSRIPGPDVVPWVFLKSDLTPQMATSAETKSSEEDPQFRSEPEEFEAAPGPESQSKPNPEMSPVILRPPAPLASLQTR